MWQDRGYELQNRKNSLQLFSVRVWNSDFLKLPLKILCFVGVNTRFLFIILNEVLYFFVLTSTLFLIIWLAVLFVNVQVFSFISFMKLMV